MLLVWSRLAFGAQGEVEIVHDPIQCWPVDEFLLIQSSFVPPEDIQTVKFYFRSTDQPDYYYVELTLGPGGGRAIAPKADPATAGVTYYLELITLSYTSFRSEEHNVPVASGTECKRRDPETAYYTGENPDIAIGATRGGVPQMPPGFQSEGISRFMSVTGTQGAPAGGGISGKTVGFIAAIGGGAGAALALSGGGGSDPTTTGPIGGITTSSPPGISTSTATGGITSTTTTSGGGGTSTVFSTTTAVGGASTTTVVGSTTTVFGGSTTTVVGGSTTTTVVGGSTTTSVGTSSTTTSVGTSSTTTSVGTSSTTTSVGTSSTTTSVGSSTTTTVVGSSTTTSVVGSSTTTRPSTTTSVGTSTTTSAPSTTTSAASTTTTSTPSSTSSSTTTRPSTTTTAAAGADMRLDSISDSLDPVVTGGVVEYDIGVTNLGPNTAPNVVINIQHAASDRILGSLQGPSCRAVGSTLGQCSIGSLPSGGSAGAFPQILLSGAGTHNITVTVGGGTTDPNTGNNSQTEQTRVTASLKEKADSRPRVVQLLSTLDVRPPDGRIRARVTVNDAVSEETSNTGPRSHRLGARPGENHARAQAELGSSDSGTWRFDLGATSTLVPGSLRVQTGRVLAQDGSSITFALEGGTSELRFTFELTDTTP